MSSLKQFHKAEAEKARRLYIDARDPLEGNADWNLALRMARRDVLQTLRRTSVLAEIATALEADAGHMLVLRNLCAPPISQDQFKMICPSWPKQAEKNRRGISTPTASEAEAALLAWLDYGRCRWVSGRRAPTRREVREVLLGIAPIIAGQIVATARRSRLSMKQEQAVVTMLHSMGWARLPSKMIDERADVPSKHFMHKTRFSTSQKSSQEVDIACGLDKSVVLAMECKVTNDETNSVKRINDVLKKASAWKGHWGNFVRTAALLEGVIAPKDVDRLLDEGVEVFWSHDLDAFKDWLEAQF